MSERALAAARASGLVEPGRPLLVLLSGGADSVCLLDVARELGAEVSALHVNHGLRAEAGEDEAHCEALCARLGVPLAVERLDPARASGNLQAWARAARYALAERHAAGDYAAAHTATDQAETVLYRLAVSPGRRALLGMVPRRGRLVRPLLAATRADARAWCEARGLAWREDPSNADPRFARARVRHEALPVLEALNPRAVEAIAETSRQLRDEAEVLDAAVGEALARLAGGEVAGLPLPLERLRGEPPALARLVLRRAAELAGGGEVSLSRADAEALLALGGTGGTRALDLGRGLRAVVEYGLVRFTRAREAEPPAAVELPVPGEARFGAWTVSARLGAAGEAVLDAGALGPVARVRAWRDGDRMRPAGLGGTKTLQDLFVDAKVPRELRRTLPVVEAGGEIAWVAGVAVGERFALPPGSRAAAVSLAARRAGGAGGSP
jgi:tRNA(Ile)-lysidine synthase